MEKEDNKELQRYFSRISLEPLKPTDVQMLLRRHFIRIAQFYKSILAQEVRIGMDMNDCLKKALKIMEENLQGYAIPVILLEFLDEIITEEVYAQPTIIYTKENYGKE